MLLFYPFSDFHFSFPVAKVKLGTRKWKIIHIDFFITCLFVSMRLLVFWSFFYLKGGNLAEIMAELPPILYTSRGMSEVKNKEG